MLDNGRLRGHYLRCDLSPQVSTNLHSEQVVDLWLEGDYCLCHPSLTDQDVTGPNTFGAWRKGGRAGGGMSCASDHVAVGSIATADNTCSWSWTGSGIKSRPCSGAFLQSVALTVPTPTIVVGTMPCRYCKVRVWCRKHPFCADTSCRKGGGPMKPLEVQAGHAKWLVLPQKKSISGADMQLLNSKRCTTLAMNVEN